MYTSDHTARPDRRHPVGVGRVAERFKALVLKTSEAQVSAGSNPAPSANFGHRRDLLDLECGLVAAGVRGQIEAVVIRPARDRWPIVD
jgi:hypothetical protein